MQVIPVADDTNTHLTLLLELDRGEKQTIMLAQRFKADKVVIDERMCRSIAEYLELNVVGTLGVLAKGKQLGLKLKIFGGMGACLPDY